jgi:hypothetical protein
MSARLYFASILVSLRLHGLLAHNNHSKQVLPCQTATKQGFEAP